MAELPDLERQMAAWNRQAAKGEISYKELEEKIQQAGKAIDDQFGQGNLTPEAYKTQRALLELTDREEQRWRLFNDGSWNKKTDRGWEKGQPDLPDKPVIGVPDPEEGGRKRSFPLIAAIVGALILVVGGGGLWAVFGGGVPSSSPPTAVATGGLTPTAASEPVAPPVERPTFTPSPIPTDTREPSPTSTPDVVSSTGTAELIPPEIITTPSSLTPTALTTPASPVEIDSERAEEGDLLENGAVAESGDSAVISAQPSPIDPVPSGAIIYAAFDNNAETYNLYRRRWPDLDSELLIAGASQPAVDPDGHRLLYRAWSEPQGLIEYDLASHSRLEVINIVEAIQPAWSPDGGLAYAANLDNQGRIYITNRDHLLPVDGSVGGPAWLNSNRLAFHGCVVNRGCGIFAANPNGANLQPLTNSGSAQHRNPVLAPAGDRLAFMSDANGNWDIYVIPADAAPQDTPQRLTSNPAQEGLPAWSPNGRWLAYVSNQNGRWFMEMVPAEGGPPQSLFELEGSVDGFVVAGTAGQEGWLHEQISWFE